MTLYDGDPYDGLAEENLTTLMDLSLLIKIIFLKLQHYTLYKIPVPANEIV
jgi:hypothetical protein